MYIHTLTISLEKDHHLSKNGLSNNIRKDGAGAHGWVSCYIC